jgi:2'-5' RNA ligase
MPGVPHALELLLDPDLDDRVRRAWDLLAVAGLPSQAQHPHPTNRPHLTLAMADDLDSGTRAELTAELAVLPLPVCLDGLVLLGARRRTVAWLVVPSTALLRLHRAVHGAVQGAVSRTGHRAAVVEPPGPPLLRPDRWVPHVTLASRMSTEQAGAVVAALGGLSAESGTMTAARFYDTVARTTMPLHR